MEGCVTEIDIKPGMTEDDSNSFHVDSPSTSFDPSPKEETKTVTINYTSNHQDRLPAATISDDNNEVDNCPKKRTSSNNFYLKSNQKLNIPPSTSAYHNKDPTQLSRKMKSIDINAFNCHDNMASSNSMNTKSYDVTRASSNNDNDVIDGRTIDTSNFDHSKAVYVPYEELKGISTESLPPSVDPLNREKSLSDVEFCEVFGMDKKSFYKLPPWKQTNQKKAKWLF